jgi:3-oxoacyl-[acyl-carrier protein] reductase
MQVEGKRIVVTGGANGCGEGIVRGLVARGARVFSTDVDEENGRRVVDDMGRPDTLRFACMDVSSRREVVDGVAQAVEFLGGLDGLVNSGGNVLSGRPEEATDEQWDTIFDVHVRGTLYTNQAVYPHLVRAGGGTIVNFGSAKGAVLAWTRNVAIDWAPDNIRVNAVAPFVESSLQRQSRDSDPALRAQLDAGVKARVKLRGGTLGRAEQDLAPLVCLLLGDGGTYLTGQTYAVDEGRAGEGDTDALSSRKPGTRARRGSVRRSCPRSAGRRSPGSWSDPSCPPRSPCSC